MIGAFQAGVMGGIQKIPGAYIDEDYTQSLLFSPGINNINLVISGGKASQISANGNISTSTWGIYSPYFGAPLNGDFDLEVSAGNSQVSAEMLDVSFSSEVSFFIDIYKGADIYIRLVEIASIRSQDILTYQNDFTIKATKRNRLVTIKVFSYPLGQLLQTISYTQSSNADVINAVAIAPTQVTETNLGWLYKVKLYAGGYLFPSGI